MSKPLLKRPASINIENLLAEAKNFAEVTGIDFSIHLASFSSNVCFSVPGDPIFLFLCPFLLVLIKLIYRDGIIFPSCSEGGR